METVCLMGLIVVDMNLTLVFLALLLLTQLIAQSVYAKVCRILRNNTNTSLEKIAQYNLVQSGLMIR